MALFKKKEQTEKVNEPKELTQQESSEQMEDENGLVKTNLVFHPDWDLTSQEKYAFMYQHQQLPLLKKNQLSIKGLKLLQYEDGFVVVAFLRNTLPKAIRIESITILLLDENGNTLAKKQFELDGIDEIPPFSCMPWRFLFENKDKLADTIPDTGWSLAFEIMEPVNPAHKLDLAESWERELPPAEKQRLEQLVASLPALGPNEVNIMGLEAKQTTEGNMIVTILIRNGSQRELQIEHLPLIVEDALGQVICQGNFTLEDFKVKANTTKPWTFIFPKELVKMENPDLSKWKVYFPQ